jgi:hypothetical protein
MESDNAFAISFVGYGEVFVEKFSMNATAKRMETSEEVAWLTLLDGVLR